MNNLLTSSATVIGSLPSYFTIVIGLLLLLCILVTSIYFMRQVFKSNLAVKDTIAWFFWNLIIMIFSLYLVILGFIQIFYPKTSNWISVIAKFIGITNAEGVGDWKIFIFFIILAFLYFRSFRNTTKISKANARINALICEIALLKESIPNKNKILRKISPSNNNPKTDSSLVQKKPHLPKKKNDAAR